MHAKHDRFDLQWVVKGAVDVDIGANPSAEGGEDEGVDDQAVKVVDIVDTFRLQVWTTKLSFLNFLVLDFLFGAVQRISISLINYFRSNLLLTRSNSLSS